MTGKVQTHQVNAEHGELMTTAALTVIGPLVAQGLSGKPLR